MKGKVGKEEWRASKKQMQARKRRKTRQETKTKGRIAGQEPISGESRGLSLETQNPLVPEPTT